MARYDAEAVRQLANGRWLEILISVAGIPGDLLDPKREHPCPKCGGETRFRLLDEEAGAVFCNQCFNKNNGDGFAAVQWSLGCDFPEALQKVAEYLGAPPEEGGKKRRSKKSKPSVDPAKDLEWKTWAQGQVDFLLRKKPGLTTEAIQRAGGRFARYKNQFSVIAFPVIGENLDVDHPVGWALINALGGTLPVWDREGNVTGQKKVKVTYGSKPGFIGQHAVERIKLAGMVECVWKGEGITDTVALEAAIPASLRDRHVALTNSHGAGETPRWMAGILAHMPRVHLVHDADKPGQQGGLKWIEAMAMQGGSPRNVQLPYTIEETHGKDTRDFFNEGNTYNDLWAIADKTPETKFAKTATGEIDLSKVERPQFKEILNKLQLEVMWQDSIGRIKLYSSFLESTSDIRNSRSQLDHATLIQIAGEPAVDLISSDPDEDQYTMTDVRKAISYFASSRQETHEEKGIGIWQGLDDDKQGTNSLILVNNTRAARWTDANGLEEIRSPRSDGLVFDFDAQSEGWFNFGELKRLTQEARDVEWRKSVHDQLIELLSRWRWEDEEIDPILASGLILSGWVQTIWAWRPHVFLVGESNAGKTMLFSAVAGSNSQLGLYGNLAFKPQKTSEAGLRQGIGNTARVVFCDEAEHSKHRQEVFEMLRVASRGGDITRGTASGKMMRFRVCHSVWLAATESGLFRQPDLNRFLVLKLLRPIAGKENELTLPENGALHRLGQKLLASAIVCALPAKAMAASLRRFKSPRVDPRMIECYSAPVAMLSQMRGGDAAYGEAQMAELVGRVNIKQQGSPDHVELMHSILSADVQCPGKGNLMVAQILRAQERSQPGQSDAWAEYVPLVESAGVKLMLTKAGDRELVVAHNSIRGKLLRNTVWANQQLGQLLERFEGADATKKRRFGGHPIPATVIPWPIREIQGEDDAEDEIDDGVNRTGPTNYVPGAQMF